MQPTTINNVGTKELYPTNLNSNIFREAVKQIIETYEIDEIVETGTYNGLGSTRIFAETKKYVFTIECNYNNFVSATQNLSAFDNVCVIHGFSLNKQDTIKWLLNEEFDGSVKTDSDYPKTFYMREISQMVAVESALEIFAKNDRKQLVFLDSAGGIGHLEFLTFMEFNAKNKILMLDDIDHIKHKKSVEMLKEWGYAVNISADNRFAWTELIKK
jgi:hypothetical protein